MQGFVSLVVHTLVLALATSWIRGQELEPLPDELVVGEPCLSGQPICPSSDAFCNSNGKCVCRSGYGRGNFACHKKNQEYCHIINDPVAYTFGNEHFDLPLPCRWLAASVTAYQMYSHWNVLTCKTEVHAYNVRSLGKSFVGGVDVTAEYSTNPSTDPIYQLHFRIMGWVRREGTYHFSLGMRDSFDYNLPFLEDFNLGEYNGGKLGEVRFEVNDDLRSAHLLIENCGLELTFRPAHPTLGMHQRLMPGLAIAYNKEDFVLSWERTGEAMCLQPNLNIITTGHVAESAGLSPSEAFLWRALYTGVHQVIDMTADHDNPSFTPTCPRVQEILKQCTDLREHIEAMEMCHFILSAPLFLNCYSQAYSEETSSAAAMNLFGTCVEAFCTRSDLKCSTVQLLVAEAGCTNKSYYDGLKEHKCLFSLH